MSYKQPGNQSPGGSTRSAPYQKIYVNPAAVDLTTDLDQCRNSASGVVVISTGAAAALAWKDCAGNVCALTGIDDNVILDLPFGISELTTSTTVTVIVYWHGTGVR